jgi:phage-related protein
MCVLAQRSGRCPSLNTRRSRRGPRRPTESAAQPQPPPRRRWRWFHNEPGGRLLAQEELDSLAVAGRAGLVKAMERYRDRQTRRNDVKPLGEGLFELRYRYGSEQFRLIFMHWGEQLVALAAFQKKQRKTPKVDLDRARERANQWQSLYGARPAEEGRGQVEAG